MSENIIFTAVLKCSKRTTWNTYMNTAIQYYSWQWKAWVRVRVRRSFSCTHRLVVHSVAHIYTWHNTHHKKLMLFAINYLDKDSKRVTHSLLLILMTVIPLSKAINQWQLWQRSSEKLGCARCKCVRLNERLGVKQGAVEKAIHTH